MAESVSAQFSLFFCLFIILFSCHKQMPRTLFGLWASEESLESLIEVATGVSASVFNYPGRKFYCQISTE